MRVGVARRHRFRGKAASSASAGWTPPDSANLALWLKGTTGVEESSGDDAEDTDPVEYWRDQSGNSNDAVQATLSQRPTWESDSPQHLIWDGSDDRMATGTAVKSAFDASFTVLAWVNLATDAANTVLAKDFTSHSPPYYQWEISTQAGRIFVTKTWQGASFSTHLQVNSSSSAFSLDTWVMIGFVYDDSAESLTQYLNGAANGIDTTAAGTMTNHNTGVTLGNRQNVTDPINGRIGEVLIYSSALTADDINDIYGSTGPNA